MENVLKNKIIDLKVWFLRSNREKIKQTNVIKRNSERKNKAIVLIVSGDRKLHYFIVGKISSVLQK